MEPPLLRNCSLAVKAIAGVVILSLFILSCSDHDSRGSATRRVSDNEDFLSEEEFSQSLRACLQPVDTTDSVFVKKGIPSASIGMRIAYQNVGHMPVWCSEDGINDAAIQLISAIDSLRDDGLDPERYYLSALRYQRDELQKDGKANLNRWIEFDTTCTLGYLRASRDLLLGAIRPRTADSLWFTTNDSVWNAPQLLAANKETKAAFTGFHMWRSTFPTYILLREEYRRYKVLATDSTYTTVKRSGADADISTLIRLELPWLRPDPSDSLTEDLQLVRAYQHYRGIPVNGKVDSTMRSFLFRPADSTALLLAANMERIRWLPRSTADQYVLVNIPLMELFYRRNGSDAFHMRVVVGKASRQTPALIASMANVVFNPPWGVPPTILKKDVLPGISKRGGNYLARKGLKAYNQKGEVVPNASVTPANYRNYTFRQPPGARNALGEIKFNLPNPWDIYLHDTPHREDFPRRNRALSSGCIRVEKPKEFAAFLLNEIEQKEFSPEHIDSVIQTRRTRYEGLKNRIPVHIVYLTAFEDSSGQHPRLLPDIYKRDRRLLAALLQ